MNGSESVQADIDPILGKAEREEPLTQAEATELLELPLHRAWELQPTATQLRERHRGRHVDLCSIVNIKSGGCSEDCAFCSQSAHFKARIDRYPLMSVDGMVDAAKRAEKWQARRFCLVSAGRAMAGDAINVICEAVRRIREETSIIPGVSLGSIGEEEMLKLKEAGLGCLHHNVETAPSHFPSICTTHPQSERIETVRRAKRLGFEVCSGGIFGMGETPDQRAEFICLLRELDPAELPLNFLNPVAGTPLGEVPRLVPLDILRIIAVARLVNPKKFIKVCAERVNNLRDLQSQIFAFGADGLMIGDFLTIAGRQPTDDLQMISDLGLEVAPPGEART